ncbi:MAG: YceI family protein [Streptosporangiaceae bacterium]
MTQPQTTPAPGNYRLDPERSTVRADVKAMFGLITVHGTFRLRSGEIVVAADPAGSTVQVVVDAGSYASGNAKRDTDVMSATLIDAKAHPDITFAGTEVRQDGGDWVVSGPVTAHGTSVAAKLRVHEVAMENGAARFRVTTQLDRASFGVTGKKGMVGATVNVTIDAVGVPA